MRYQRIYNLKDNHQTNRTIYIASNYNIQGAISLNLLQINFLQVSIDLNMYDSIIFTSKNSVKSLKNLDISNLESYAISEVTGNYIKNNGGNLIFTASNTNGDDFAYKIIQYLKNKKVLYVRAKKIVSNITNILRNHNIQCDEIITYETQCVKKKTILELNKNSIIIFSSPSTIKCFLNNYKWDKSYYAIAIGTTTASALNKNMIYSISKENSIQSCFELAKTI